MRGPFKWRGDRGWDAPEMRAARLSVGPFKYSGASFSVGGCREPGP